MIGRIEVWKSERGFGFVTMEGTRKTAFLHWRDIEGLATTTRNFPTRAAQPRVGDTLEYQLIESERGPRAVSAKIVKPAEPADARGEEP